MRYDAYRRQTDTAARTTGGQVISLAGGFYGVALEAGVILALDLDAPLPEWLAWVEDRDGEHCCDSFQEVIGVVCPVNFADLPMLAVSVLRQHVHA